MAIGDENSARIIIDNSDLQGSPVDDWEFLMALGSIQTNTGNDDLEADKALVQSYIVNASESAAGKSVNWVSEINGIPNQSFLNIADRIISKFHTEAGSWAGIINDLYGLFGYDSAHSFVAQVMGFSGVLSDVFANETELISFLKQIGIPEGEINSTVENRRQAGIS